MNALVGIILKKSRPRKDLVFLIEILYCDPGSGVHRVDLADGISLPAHPRPRHIPKNTPHTSPSVQSALAPSAAWAEGLGRVVLHMDGRSS